jgi:hypothetical protein
MDDTQKFLDRGGKIIKLPPIVRPESASECVRPRGVSFFVSPEFYDGTNSDEIGCYWVPSYGRNG